MHSTHNGFAALYALLSLRHRAVLYNLFLTFAAAVRCTLYGCLLHRDPVVANALHPGCVHGLGAAYGIIFYRSFLLCFSFPNFYLLHS